MLVRARGKDCLGCKELRSVLLCSSDTANRGVLGCKTDKCICEAIPHKESAELCDSELVLDIQCFGFRRVSFKEVLMLKYTFEDPISNLERRA
jgi:hypothetical protein